MPDKIELLKKLHELTKREKQIVKDKENAATNYNDELKMVKAEVKDTLRDLEQADGE